MIVALTILALVPTYAHAQEASPAPYDWPFRARSAEISSFVRTDVAMATSHQGREGRHEYAMTQLASVGIAVTDWLAPYVRGGWAFQHDRFDVEGAIFANLELGAAAFTPISREVRLGGHFAVFVPTGSGRGPSAPSFELAAQQEGARARLGTDSSLFLTHHGGISASIAIAYVHAGLVAQMEIGLEGLWRIEGPEDGALAPAGAIHLGYFVLPELSLALELTHHQWAGGRAYLGTPASITSVLLGARAHVAIDRVTLRPGASYSHALGGQLAEIHHHVLQLDLVIDL